MIAEPTSADGLIAIIRDWFRLLAADRWDEASGMLDEPNSYGIHWTPEQVRHALDLAFGPSSRFRIAHPDGLQFTDPDTASGNPHAEVVTLNDGSGFSAEHDVPLNGEWSELTAQFEFKRRANGLAVILHDLHVL